MGRTGSMAIIRKKLAEKPAPGPKAFGMNPAGKGKPAPKKPAEKPAAKQVAPKPASKPAAKAPVAKAPPQPKAPKAPPVLNKGALAAKEAAARRAAEAA